MKRRLFLSGVGGAALAAPFLSSLERSAQAQSASTPRRSVIFYTNNGCLTDRWFPSVVDGAVSAAAMAGTTLDGLSSYAAKLLFPRGIAMFPRGFYNDHFDPHDQGMGSKLTCAPLNDASTDHYPLGHSLDHEIARRVNAAGTTESPLVLTVGGAFGGGNVKSFLSYSAAETPYAAESNPANVFSGLTGLLGSGTMTESDYLVSQGNSVIDLVRDDLDTLRRINMSGADHKKIDDWLALLRETELQVIPVACNGEAAAALGITDAAVQGVSGGFDMAKAFVEGGDMMIKLIALTMMCDANRSIVLQWPGFVTFDWDGVHHDYSHHGLSHRNGDNGVTEAADIPGVEDLIAEIDRWYAGRYAKLVGLIDSVSEGEGTMLDNSAVMWLPELADGDAHNNDNLPIVIAGSCGGYLKQGISLNLDPGGGGGMGFGSGGLPLNKLHTTLLNAVGAKADDGGPIVSWGVMDNNDEATVTDPGEIEAIKA